jgi:hypothetical protein
VPIVVFVESLRLRRKCIDRDMTLLTAPGQKRKYSVRAQNVCLHPKTDIAFLVTQFSVGARLVSVGNMLRRGQFELSEVASAGKPSMPPSLTPGMFANAAATVARMPPSSSGERSSKSSKIIRTTPCRSLSRIIAHFLCLLNHQSGETAIGYEYCLALHIVIHVAPWIVPLLLPPLVSNATVPLPSSRRY